ncbi:MAG TPA: glycosyltransferase, partial [Candidatus Dormibacteraeota bacterium]|nr:glycosyltransferase [Candidatus Dormibacteraeota bacterium]
MTIGNSATALTPPELSLVIPTRDEAANVRALLARIDGALSGVDCEVIVVDDSDDDTVTLLRQAQRRHPGLHCHHRDPADRTGGLSTAVVEGLRRARGTYVCVMDADLQHPPERIPAMLAVARAGADIVVASRYLREGSRAGLASTWRRLVSRATALVARALFTEARATTDPLAGFFLGRRELLEGREFRPIGFKILLELLVCSPPLVVADVALAFAPRTAGSSKASIRQGLLYLRHLLSLLRDVPGSARRWKFAAVGLSGLAIFTAALAFGRLTLGWPPLAAWALAFAPSFAWTFAANQALTFADMRRGWDDRGALYPRSALVAGGLQLLAFAALLRTGWPVLAVGVEAAVLSMGVNAALNYRLVHRRSHAPRHETSRARAL